MPAYTTTFEDEDRTLTNDTGDLSALIDQHARPAPLRNTRQKASRGRPANDDGDGAGPSRKRAKKAGDDDAGDNDAGDDDGDDGDGTNTKDSVPNKRGRPPAANKPANKLSAAEMAAARISDLQILGLGAKKDECMLTWDEEQISRAFAAAQIHHAEGRNETLRKQAKAVEKQYSAAALEVRKIEAEAKLAMASAEAKAIDRPEWSTVKMKALELELATKQGDYKAHQRCSTLRKIVLEHYTQDPTPQTLDALRP